MLSGTKKETKEFRFNRLQRAKLRMGPRIQRKSMKDERAKQPPLWAEKSEQTFSLPLGFGSSLQIWGVGWAEDSSPPPIDLAQASPGSPGWVRPGGRQLQAPGRSLLGLAENTQTQWKQASKEEWSNSQQRTTLQTYFQGELASWNPLCKSSRHKTAAA